MGLFGIFFAMQAVDGGWSMMDVRSINADDRSSMSDFDRRSMVYDQSIGGGDRRSMIDCQLSIVDDY